MAKTSRARREEGRMSRNQIELAVREGLPFSITMADGKSYVVRHPLQLGLGKTFAVVVTDDDLAHILPLLTMTGLTYLGKEPGEAA